MRDFRQGDNESMKLASRIIAAISLAALLLGAARLAWAAGEHDHRSPDGMLRAVVAGNARGESHVLVQTRQGHTLATRNFSSADGEHGRIVLRAAWTPDSRFFVFSTISSGGDNAWHYLTYFYSRGSKRISCLDDVIGPVTTPNFVLKAPDIIQTRIRRHQDRVGIPITRRLSIF